MTVIEIVIVVIIITVAEAQTGLDALNMCIQILDRFYKTVKKELYYAILYYTVL